MRRLLLSHTCGRRSFSNICFSSAKLLGTQKERDLCSHASKTQKNKTCLGGKVFFGSPVRTSVVLEVYTWSVSESEFLVFVFIWEKTVTSEFRRLYTRIEKHPSKKIKTTQATKTSSNLSNGDFVFGQDSISCVSTALKLFHLRFCTGAALQIWLCSSGVAPPLVQHFRISDVLSFRFRSSVTRYTLHCKRNRATNWSRVLQRGQLRCQTWFCVSDNKQNTHFSFQPLWTAENYGDLVSRSNCISLSGRTLMFAQFSLSGQLNSW